jgi:hypothetical protein
MTVTDYKRRDQVSVRLGPELVETVEQAAAQERRTVSNLIRCVLADWAQSRQQQERAA